MKNILMAGLLVLSSAAFAGGRNANQPVNPPQPPTPEETRGICAKFYNKTIPHYHYDDVDLKPLEMQSVTTIVPETLGLAGATVVCTIVLPLKIVEWFCSHHACDVNPNEEQWTRPYP